MTENANIPKLKNWYQNGQLGRRDFLRQSTLLGLSATAAYSFVGLTAPSFAVAQNMPKGGTIRHCGLVCVLLFYLHHGSGSRRPVTRLP